MTPEEIQAYLEAATSIEDLTDRINDLYYLGAFGEDERADFFDAYAPIITQKTIYQKQVQASRPEGIEKEIATRNREEQDWWEQLQKQGVMAGQQRSQAILAGLQGTPRRERTFPMPEVDVRGEVEKVLPGYAPGTKLRGFMGSELPSAF